MPNKTFAVFEDLVEVLISSKSTGGAHSVIAQNVRPGSGPPPHIHRHEDEILVALHGEFELFLNGAWTKVVCGEPKYLQRGELHAFRNCGNSMGRIMAVATPGGLDEYLEAISPIRMPQDAEKLFAISDGYGITFPQLAIAETVSDEELAFA